MAPSAFNICFFIGALVAVAMNALMMITMPPNHPGVLATYDDLSPLHPYELVPAAWEGLQDAVWGKQHRLTRAEKAVLKVKRLFPGIWEPTWAVDHENLALYAYCWDNDGQPLIQIKGKDGELVVFIIESIIESPFLEEVKFGNLHSQDHLKWLVRCLKKDPTGVAARTMFFEILKVLMDPLNVHREMSHLARTLPSAVKPAELERMATYHVLRITVSSHLILLLTLNPDMCRK